MFRQIDGKIIPMGRRAKTGEGNSIAVGQIGCMGQIDANPDNHRVTNALQQNAGEFRATDQNIVRPFEHRQMRRWHQRRNRCLHRKPRDQRERPGMWLMGINRHLGRTHEIAQAVVPNPTEAPPPGVLAVSNEPTALPYRLTRRQPCGKISVGGAGKAKNFDQRGQYPRIKPCETAQQQPSG